MFGKRTDGGSPPTVTLPPSPSAAPAASPAAVGAGFVPDLKLGAPAGFGNNQAAAARVAAVAAPKAPPEIRHKSESYYDIKSTIFNALIDAIDLTKE